jgi:hypothetical protein
MRKKRCVGRVITSIPQEVNVIHVKEEPKDKAIEPIEWFLMTNEPVGGPEAAREWMA